MVSDKAHVQWDPLKHQPRKKTATVAKTAPTNSSSRCLLYNHHNVVPISTTMAIQSKPIPALYVVYILRSTVRHGSLYIGSTPNPPRRLNQHNGKAKGGAARTAKNRLRPWEMVSVVAGFPSMVAALKFEYETTTIHHPPLLHLERSRRLTSGRWLYA